MGCAEFLLMGAMENEPWEWESLTDLENAAGGEILRV